MIGLELYRARIGCYKLNITSNIMRRVKYSSRRIYFPGSCSESRTKSKLHYQHSCTNQYHLKNSLILFIIFMYVFLSCVVTYAMQTSICHLQSTEPSKNVRCQPSKLVWDAGLRIPNVWHTSTNIAHNSACHSSSRTWCWKDLVSSCVAPSGTRSYC